MSEITSLVTAGAVKEVLYSEEVRSALRQKLCQNLEARLDAEVDIILDGLLGVPAALEPKGITGDGSVSDDGEPTPNSDMMMQACARSHQYVPMVFILLQASGQRETRYVPGEKNHDGCVIHHVSGGNGLLIPAVVGQGSPTSVGGSRRAGESAVWVADMSDQPVLQNQRGLA